jgi:hypothetical protein
VAAVVAVLALATALLGALVIGLLRSHADILRALHDLGVDPGAGGGDPRRFGAIVPAATAQHRSSPTDPAGPTSGALPAATDVQGTGPDGTAIHVAVSGVDHQTLLAFLTPGCELCLGFWEALAEPAQRDRLGPGVRMVIVTQDGSSEMPSAVSRLAPRDVTTVMSTAAWEAYEVPVAPFFALVDGPTGQVAGEGAAPSWDQLIDLLGRAVADRSGQTAGRPSGRQTAAVARRRWAEREADTDAALLAAGIAPGDPRLHHDHAVDPTDRPAADADSDRDAPAP